MKRIAIVTVGVLVLGAATAAAQDAAQNGAQDSVQTVRDLYAAAAYEDALAAVKRMQAERPQREVEQYRLFSLFALGRTDEAQKAMEALISSDPAYVLDPVETPPRVHQAFSETRLRLLPDVARAMYLSARGALDRKERAEAISGFERLLALIDDAGAASPSLDELRILASGFLDLSRALQAPPPAAPAAAAVEPPAESTGAAQPPAGAGAPPADARPVAIRQDLPAWMPTDSFSRRTTYSGSVRVLVGADGRVISATLVRSIHPSYDPGLLQAARNWVYEPERSQGAAVEAEITVEVNLRPPQ
jgi:TonB family protein